MIKFKAGTENQITIEVSNEDADLSKYHWGKSNGYAMGCKNKYKGKMLHRIILERIVKRPLLRHEFTDHIDRNRGNNQRHNLRMVTNIENQVNRPTSKASTTGYKGVFFDKNAAKSGKKSCYRASYGTRETAVYLGMHKTPELAAEAYNKYVLTRFGNIAFLNPLPNS